MDAQQHPLDKWLKDGNRNREEFCAEVGISLPFLSLVLSRKRGVSLGVALRIRALAGDAVPLESLTGTVPQRAEVAQ